MDNWQRLLRYLRHVRRWGWCWDRPSCGCATDLLGWSGLVSNLVAFVIANIPVYHLNRSWVWDRYGPSRWRREVLPFWMISLAGLALSVDHRGHCRPGDRQRLVHHGGIGGGVRHGCGW